MDDLSVCRSVGRCIGRFVGLSSALWRNGGSDPDAVWRRRSDVSRDEARSGVWGSVHGKGTFGANLGLAIVINGDSLSQRRGPLPKLFWADLLLLLLVCHLMCK